MQPISRRRALHVGGLGPAAAIYTVLHGANA
jgi:hypothetical protein